MNNGVCRASPATPGLLISIKNVNEQKFKSRPGWILYSYLTGLWKVSWLWWRAPRPRDVEDDDDDDDDDDDEEEEEEDG